MDAKSDYSTIQIASLGMLILEHKLTLRTMMEDIQNLLSSRQRRRQKVMGKAYYLTSTKLIDLLLSRKWSVHSYGYAPKGGGHLITSSLSQPNLSTYSKNADRNAIASEHKPISWGFARNEKANVDFIRQMQTEKELLKSKTIK